MLGAIIGDIAGSVYEWNNIKTKDFQLFSNGCAFTDDAVMTVAVAEALLNGGAADDFIDALKKFGKLYPDLGYGGYFRKWLFSSDREPYNSFGNGSAMRVAPCAWFADSLEEAESLAEASAVVTHNHPEGIKGAQATAAAIYLARTDQKKDKIKEYIESEYRYDLSRTLDEIRPVYRFNETCQETVPEAIIAFLESNGFEDAIRNAISLGGDSDTLAAITGSIAEAAYGVPDVIRTRAFHKLDDRLSAVINAWLDAGKPLGTAIAKKSNWKTKEFSKPHTIKVDFRFNERDFALLRFGLLPEVMEDKWFAFFEDGKLAFHSSWTGTKIYEAEVHKRDALYEITKLKVERDVKRYTQTKDAEDVRSFHYLVGRGLLGLDVEPPIESGDGNDLLQGWSSYGRMLF